jgi:hypothetical protein
VVSASEARRPEYGATLNSVMLIHADNTWELFVLGKRVDHGEWTSEDREHAALLELRSNGRESVSGGEFIVSHSGGQVSAAKKGSSFACVRIATR